jgi:molecular chaperone GrpE
MFAEKNEDVAPDSEGAVVEPVAEEQAEDLTDAGNGGTGAEKAEGSPEDEGAALGEALAAAEAQAAEYLDGWQRARAEFANYRRRQEQQRRQQTIAAQSHLLTQLLPVIDDLERAFEAVPEAVADDPWVSGLLMVRNKWLSALEKVGLTEVPVATGDAFDPTHHEALTHEPNDECAEGTVIQVIQRGYQFDDIVLRPALVRVSSGAPDVACELPDDEADA